MMNPFRRGARSPGRRRSWKILKRLGSLVRHLRMMRRRTFLKSVPAGFVATLAFCRQPYALVDPDPVTPRRAAVPPGFLFATGIENSYPALPDGRRSDQLKRCGHYEHWRQDFELARGLGVGAIRYGPAWYRTHPTPGRFDWSSVDDQMHWLRSSGIAVIADLCHFGVPDWIGGFQDPALPIHLADYAREFARRYSWVRHFTPVNEMFVAANFSAMLGWWNECLTGREAFGRALRNLAMAHEMAVEAIIAERPDAIIVQAESFERFTPADDRPGSGEQARFWNDARFAALDLTLGRMPAPPVREMLVESGMSTADFTYLRERRASGQRWIGMDYYITSEQVVAANGRKRSAPERVGLAAVAREYHHRYGLPILLSETSRVSSHAIEWLGAQWAETQQLLATGVPVKGFTWFPLGDVLDWRHALREIRGDVDPIGLYDLDRAPHPVARAYAELIASTSRRIAARPMERAQEVS